MSKSYRGGCACGALRYDVGGEPLFQNHCQCRQCQQLSGTGHGSYLSFERAAVALTGEAARWSTRGDSGLPKTRGFCPVCGSPVFMTFEAAPAILAVHAASLDEPAVFEPQAVTYASRALPWDTIAPGPVRFDTMPTG